MQHGHAGPRASAASTLAKPIAAWPALWPCRARRARRAPAAARHRARSGAARTSRLKPRAKSLARDAPQRVARRRDPDAAPGQPALEIGDHRAVRADDEADQLGDRLHLPGDDAKRSVPARAARGPVERVIVRPRQHASLGHPLSAGAIVVSAAALLGRGGGARSASVIQPALRRACMIIASASSRDRSKPSRMPGCALGLAVLALGPAGQVVGGAAGQILDRLDAVLAERHQHLRW